MEISQVITGMILFVMVMFIADLYIEVKELKRRPKGAWDRPLPKYDNPPAPPRRLLREEFVKAQEGEIKELKAELNKCKFDYACEVAGEKTERPQKRIVELESIIEGKSTTIKMQNTQIKDANKEVVRLKGIIEEQIKTIKVLKPETIKKESPLDCPDCQGTGVTNLRHKSGKRKTSDCGRCGEEGQILHS